MGGGECRIGERGERREEQAGAEALDQAGQHDRGGCHGKVETAHLPEREGADQEAGEQHPAGPDQSHQSRHRQERDQ